MLYFYLNNLIIFNKMSEFNFIEYMNTLSCEKFPSSVPKTKDRRYVFWSYLVNIFSGIKGDFRLDHVEIRGDGNRFLNAFMRFCSFTRFGEIEVPNKDLTEFNENERMMYEARIQSLNDGYTQFARQIEPGYVHNDSFSAYSYIANYLVETFSIQIIVMEYDSINTTINRVIVFERDTGATDSIILLNCNHCLSLIFPRSTIGICHPRNLHFHVGREIIEKSRMNGLLIG